MVLSNSFNLYQYKLALRPVATRPQHLCRTLLYYWPLIANKNENKHMYWLRQVCYAAVILTCVIFESSHQFLSYFVLHLAIKLFWCDTFSECLTKNSVIVSGCFLQDSVEICPKIIEAWVKSYQPCLGRIMLCFVKGKCRDQAYTIQIRTQR